MDRGLVRRAAARGVQPVLGPNSYGQEHDPAHPHRLPQSVVGPRVGHGARCRHRAACRRGVRLGYVPEDAPLYAHMRVREFLRFMGRVRGLDGAAAAARDRRGPSNGSRSRMCSTRRSAGSRAATGSAWRSRRRCSGDPQLLCARRADEQPRPAPDHRDARAGARAVAGAADASSPHTSSPRSESASPTASRSSSTGALLRRAPRSLARRSDCEGVFLQLTEPGRRWSASARSLGKELAALFRSPIAWILIGVFLGVDGLLVHAHAVQRQYATLVHIFFQAAGRCCCWSSRWMKIHSFAEERRSGTLELLLQLYQCAEESEDRGREVRRGCQVVLAAMIALTGTYAAVLGLYGTPEWGASLWRLPRPSAAGERAGVARHHGISADREPGDRGDRDRRRCRSCSGRSTRSPRCCPTRSSAGSSACRCSPGSRRSSTGAMYLSDLGFFLTATAARPRPRDAGPGAALSRDGTRSARPRVPLVSFADSTAGSSRDSRLDRAAARAPPDALRPLEISRVSISRIMLAAVAVAALAEHHAHAARPAHRPHAGSTSTRRRSAR